MGNRFLLRSIPLLFCLVSPLEAEKSTEPFHVQATRLVVRLEHKITDKERRSTWKPDGSAFFVGTEHGLYIVGARHVVEGKGYDVRARVPSLLEKTGETEVIELRLPNSKWTFHPDNGDDETPSG